MKKIIATVLAMVMALALCATAFALSAADKAYDNKGKELEGDYTYEAVKATSSKKVDAGTIKHYDVYKDGTFVAYYVAADASAYDLKLTTDGKYGASTVAAVQRYQRRNGLTADGSVGKATWEKMF